LINGAEDFGLLPAVRLGLCVLRFVADWVLAAGGFPNWNMKAGKYYAPNL